MVARADGAGYVRSVGWASWLYMIARRGSLWWLERMALGTYDRLVELAGCTL